MTSPPNTKKLPLQQGHILEDQVEVSSGLVLQTKEQPDTNSDFEQAEAVHGAETSPHEVGGQEDQKQPEASDEGHDAGRDQEVQQAPQLRRKILDEFPGAQQHLRQQS